MDQELITYFDVRFGKLAQQMAEETAQQFAAAREETAQQFVAAREETAQQFAAAREETAQQFAAAREETVQQIAKLREETISRFEKGEETARHTEILIEDLRHKLRLVAEVVIGANEKLDLYRAEAKVEFSQVKGWVEPYYKELDGRVRNLDDRAYLTEGRVDGMDGRLHVLENRAERQRGDVYDALRKMLGKPPLPPPVTSE